MPTQKFIKILSSLQNIMEFDQLLGSNCSRQQPVAKQQRYFSIILNLWETLWIRQRMIDWNNNDFMLKKLSFLRMLKWTKGVLWSQFTRKEEGYSW